MNHVTHVNYVKRDLAYEAWFLHVEHMNHERSDQGLWGLLDSKFLNSEFSNFKFSKSEFSDS